MNALVSLKHLNLDALAKASPSDAHQAACACSHDTPALFPVLTGIPGFGTAEIANRFIPGSFYFSVKLAAGESTLMVISGQDGKWSSARSTATQLGDPNLASFMPKDADFSIVATGYRFWLSPIDTADAAGALELANVVAQTQIRTNKNGSNPIILPAFGAADVVGELEGVTPTLRSPGQVRPFPMIARRIDIRNDYLALAVPAAASECIVTLELEGYAIANRELKGDDSQYLEAAWMGRAARSYPTGIVGPLFARALAAIRGK